ncbi:MAG: hypothetical protein R2770_12360 [Acidimicrobiales bacterium]|nr:hypothetical protein [Acidimicrobiales bacterium]
MFGSAIDYTPFSQALPELACAYCRRPHAVPCANCGKAVCEVHQAGFRLAEVAGSEDSTNLCPGCERQALVDLGLERRREMDESRSRAAAMERGRRGPLLEALWWASNVWADVRRVGMSLEVDLRVIGLDLTLAAVREQVVLSLSRAGLAGVPDQHLAPVLDAVLQAAGICPVTEIDARRRFGFTKEVTGHQIVPLPGRHLDYACVAGAVIAPDNVWWGSFKLEDGHDPTDSESYSPVGTFERHDEPGAGAIGVLSAVARLLPSSLLR